MGKPVAAAMLPDSDALPLGEPLAAPAEPEAPEAAGLTAVVEP